MLVNFCTTVVLVDFCEIFFFMIRSYIHFANAVMYPEFFAKTDTYIKSTKVPPWLSLKRKFLALKMHSWALLVIRFPCKTFFQLLKITL